MRHRIFKNENLRNAFRNVYFAREREISGDQWQRRTMRRVREIGPLFTGAGFWPSFEDLAWRLAPVNLVLILILLFLNAGLGTDVDYVSLLARDLERPSLSEFFGVEGSG